MFRTYLRTILFFNQCCITFCAPLTSFFAPFFELASSIYIPWRLSLVRLFFSSDVFSSPPPFNVCNSVIRPLLLFVVFYIFTHRPSPPPLFYLPTVWDGLVCRREPQRCVVLDTPLVDDLRSLIFIGCVSTTHPSPITPFIHSFRPSHTLSSSLFYLHTNPRSRPLRLICSYIPLI